MKTTTIIVILCLIGIGIEECMAGEMLCSYCQIAVDEIEKEAKGANITQVTAIVKAKLLPLCSKVPKAKRLACKLGLPGFIHKVVTQLVDQQESYSVCSEMTLCNLTESPRCKLCLTSISTLRVTLHLKNISSDQLLHLLLHECHNLINSTHPDEILLCQTVIEAAGPSIIDQLLYGVPYNLCAAISVCPKHSPPSLDLLGSDSSEFNSNSDPPDSSPPSPSPSDDTPPILEDVLPFLFAHFSAQPPLPDDL